jgi:hypothetical protein
VQFLVVDADPATGEARARRLPETTTGATQLADAFLLGARLAPVPDAGSVRRDPAEFGVRAAAGRTSWTVFRRRPGKHHPLHHTDTYTVDLETVLAVRYASLRPVWTPT